MSGNQFFLSIGFPFSITCNTRKTKYSFQLKKQDQGDALVHSETRWGKDGKKIAIQPKVWKERSHWTLQKL